MTEHLDVLIVGAGLSGVGAAYRVQERRPGESYAIFEARADLGGTWDLFRYPGVRSDSDMYTYGYPFRPWTGKMVAPGETIREYIRSTAAEAGITERIRFDHRVTGAEWSTADARWTVDAERSDGSSVTVTCGFLFVCSGYYRYDRGYTPEYPGMDQFAGELIHPQAWPEDLDCRGRRVVVIGSGATAMSLVPALAKQGARVTMLQRTPTYVIPKPGDDRVVEWAQKRLPAKAAFHFAAWKNLLIQASLYALSRRAPKMMRRLFRQGVAKGLPPDFDVDTHFNPPYDPWDQRPCLLPDGDLLEVLADGRAEIVTERIESFGERGLKLESGRELEAEVVVTATGFNLTFLGGIRLLVDGEEIDAPNALSYKGAMLSAVPNFAFCIGYTHLSWTLKADLVAEFVCRLLEHMERNGYERCEPGEPDPSILSEPLLESQAGYVRRKVEQMPRQGDRKPWRLDQIYPLDLRTMRRGPLEEDGLRFSSRTVRYGIVPLRGPGMERGDS